MDKSGHPIPGHPELTVEKATEIKILPKGDPVPLDLLLRSNLVQQELSRMNINILSLLDKTVQVTPQVMRMLGGLLEREVTRDDHEWTAAVASLTVSERVKVDSTQRTRGIVSNSSATSILNTPRDLKKYFLRTEKNRGAASKRKPLPLWTRIRKVKR